MLRHACGGAFTCAWLSVPRGPPTCVPLSRRCAGMRACGIERLTTHSACTFHSQQYCCSNILLATAPCSEPGAAQLLQSGGPRQRHHPGAHGHRQRRLLHAGASLCKLFCGGLWVTEFMPWRSKMKTGRSATPGHARLVHDWRQDLQRDSLIPASSLPDGLKPLPLPSKPPRTSRRPGPAHLWPQPPRGWAPTPVPRPRPQADLEPTHAAIC
jgi:hypothetical protein